MTIEAKLEETNKLLGNILQLLVNPPVTVQLTSLPQPSPAAPAVVTEKPKTTKPAKAAPAVVTKPAEVEPVPTGAADEDFNFDAEPEAVETKKLTVDDARKALVALQKAKQSPEASRGVMTKLGLTTLGALKDDQQDLIAKIIAGCEALMPKA